MEPCLLSLCLHIRQSTQTSSGCAVSIPRGVRAPTGSSPEQAGLTSKLALLWAGICLKPPEFPSRLNCPVNPQSQPKDAPLLEGLGPSNNYKASYSEHFLPQYLELKAWIHQNQVVFFPPYHFILSQAGSIDLAVLQTELRHRQDGWGNRKNQNLWNFARKIWMGGSEWLSSLISSEGGLCHVSITSNRDFWSKECFHSMTTKTGAHVLKIADHLGNLLAALDKKWFKIYIYIFDPYVCLQLYLSCCAWYYAGSLNASVFQCTWHNLQAT